MSLQPGTSVGPYEIVALLGEGGMGEVYRARDPKLNRDVAIKVLPVVFAADADRISRFKREAQALAALNHPNIAAIYEMTSGSDGNSIALVMELVEGDDLSRVIARGQVPLDDALAIARQIADAFEAAHESGIVHRDLKPANVKVRADGTVKVLDFGLASMRDPAPGTSDLSNSPTLTARATEMGMIIGTAAYMAPEQAKGKAVDRRADIWAFGVVLYEMLTGRRAFRGEDISDVLASVLKDSVNFDALPSDTPPSIRRLLRRCLERDRSKRLSSIHVARLEIDDAHAVHADGVAPSSAMPVGRQRSMSLPIVVTAVIAGLGAAGLVWQAMQPVAPEVQRFSITPGADAPIHVEINHHDLIVLPDGRGMAYQSRIGDEYQLVVRGFGQFAGIVMPSAKLGERPRGLFASPDGQWIGYQVGLPNGSNARLWKVPVGGGAPVPICDLPSNIRGAHWAAGDRIVLGVGGSVNGLFQVPAAGGTLTALTRPSRPDNEIDHRFPYQLPDGKHVLFAISRGASSDVALLDLDTGKWRVLFKDGMAPRYVSTGHIVYGSAGALRAVRFSLASLQVSGDPIEVQSGVLTKASGAVDFDVSSNGVLVFLPGRQYLAEPHQLLWRSADAPEKLLNVSVPAPAAIALSRDARFAVTAGTANNRGLWLIDLTRELATLLPTGAHDVRGPLLWSLDDRKVAFASSNGGGTGAGGIFQVAVSGTGDPERLTEAPAGTMHLPGSWLPNGLVFTSIRGAGDRDIRQLTTAAQAAVTLLFEEKNPTGGPVLSPEGRWLAYVATEGGVPRVFMRPHPEVRASRIPVGDRGQRPVWSHDGRELLFFDFSTSKVMMVQVAPAPSQEIGRPVPVPLLQDYQPDWILDVASSRRILIARPTAVAAPETATEYRVVLNWAQELIARVK